MSAIRRNVLFRQSIALLEAMGGSPAITVHAGEIPPPEQVPLLMAPGGVYPDPSGRIAPYVVAFGGVGNPVVEPDVGDTADELDWTLHLLVAAGYAADCLDAVDRVHAQLFRAELVHAGVVVGRLAPPLGYDPGPPRHITTVAPARFESPLQYRLIATAS